MTAHSARLPYELLATVSLRIVNEVHGIARVTYDISGKPRHYRVGVIRRISGAVSLNLERPGN